LERRSRMNTMFALDDEDSLVGTRKQNVLVFDAFAFGLFGIRRGPVFLFFDIHGWNRFCLIRAMLSGALRSRMTIFQSKVLCQCAQRENPQFTRSWPTSSP
jgi:hypothetical protein